MNDSSVYSADPKKISKDFIEDSPCKENENEEIDNNNNNNNNNLFEFEDNLKYGLGAKTDKEGYEIRKNIRPSRSDCKPQSIDFAFSQVSFNLPFLAFSFLAFFPLLKF